MRKALSAIGLCALVITQGCNTGDLGEVADVGVGRAKSPPAPSSAPASGGSSAESKALKLANEDMVRRRRDPSDQQVTPCKLSSGLLIIYSEGDEYLFDKSGEEILYQRFLPQPPSKSMTVAAARAATISAAATRADELDEDDARELTEEDARQAYGSTDDFKVRVCELPDTWRVIYEPKSDASGGGPHYNIDKRTREIVSKRYYQ